MVDTNILEKVLNEGIKNLRKDKEKELIEYLGDDDSYYHVIIKKAREFLGINKSYSYSSKNYWMLRGWSEAETYHKIKDFFNNQKKRHSPFSREFWMEKGYSEEEA